MSEIMTKQKKETSMKRNNLIKKFFLYLILLIITAAMLIPFIWMLSASIKTDREVFQMTPFVLIPETPRWSNYVDIWTKIPFGHVREEHRVPHNRGDRLTAFDKQLCSILFCKTGVQA